MARLLAIRSAVAELESPSLDRAMVEDLFGLSRRSAIRLMGSLGKPEPSKAMLVKRTRLLAMLDDLLATWPVQGEIVRKRAAGEAGCARTRSPAPHHPHHATPAN